MGGSKVLRSAGGLGPHGGSERRPGLLSHGHQEGPPGGRPTFSLHFLMVAVSSLTTMSTHLILGSLSFCTCFFTVASKARSGVKRPVLHPGGGGGRGGAAGEGGSESQAGPGRRHSHGEERETPTQKTRENRRQRECGPALPTAPAPVLPVPPGLRGCGRGLRLHWALSSDLLPGAGPLSATASCLLSPSAISHSFGPLPRS